MSFEVLPEHFLLNTIKYNFLGKEFDIPRDYLKYLEVNYGKNWQTPIKNIDGHSSHFITRTIIRLKQYFPKIYF